MTFNQLVAEYLHQAKVREGLTNEQLARRIGLDKGNYISMLMTKPATQSPMSLKRVRHLATAMGLKPRQCARLVLARSRNHPDSATALDKETLTWVLRSFKDAAKERRAGGGPAAT